MKIGFYTSTLGDRPVNEIIEWAKQAGFDGIEIDVNRHLGARGSLPGIAERARSINLEISSITLFGNLLHPDVTERKKIRERTQAIAQEGAEVGVPALVLFPGRNETINDEQNYADIADFLDELASLRSDGSFRIALENWPGMHKNFIATTPAGWHQLFNRIKSPFVGIEFDPSHLLWQGIDPFAAATEFRDRIFLLHGKDTKLFHDRVQSVGYSGSWWEYRLPGRGELNWKEFLHFAKTKLRFDGYVSIEHEDRDYAWPNGDLKTRKEGLEYGLAALRQALPG